MSNYYVVVDNYDGDGRLTSSIVMSANAQPQAGNNGVVNFGDGSHLNTIKMQFSRSSGAKVVQRGDRGYHSRDELLGTRAPAGASVLHIVNGPGIFLTGSLGGPHVTVKGVPGLSDGQRSRFTIGKITAANASFGDGNRAGNR